MGIVFASTFAAVWLAIVMLLAVGWSVESWKVKSWGQDPNWEFISYFGIHLLRMDCVSPNASFPERFNLFCLLHQCRSTGRCSESVEGPFTVNHYRISHRSFCVRELWNSAKVYSSRIRDAFRSLSATLLVLSCITNLPDNSNRGLGYEA